MNIEKEKRKRAFALLLLPVDGNCGVTRIV